jgi:hypothetical protein
MEGFICHIMKLSMEKQGGSQAVWKMGGQSWKETGLEFLLLKGGPG